MRIILLLFFISTFSFGQTNTYSISFENALHHEARVTATFPNLKTKTITARMSRTSPGRYAIHEFAKNVYALKATNSKGEELEIKRPDPYSWEISGHDGTVHITYTLFANRGDGTYSQVDDTHAHLNIPATFMYVEELEYRPIEVTFNTEDHPDWKIATQLKQVKGQTYYAPDLYYFMDSPTEISDFDLKEFQIEGQNIQFALHHLGTEEEFEEYFDQVKRIVEQERAVYGELPEFDYDRYTFLACYMPNVSGDGMEHRNSTILTDTESLAEGGMEGNIGTVSHEFFHAWNVERIRPDELEPFNFKEANMTGSLWFAEGFTSYYTNLILCRTNIIKPEEYVKGLNGTFNYVWNSPARDYFNPIEMSYQAPFVDAATSVDPVNRGNTFISYYSYGSVLGLALDLSLREKDLNLDDYMKLVWNTYGKPEVAYNIPDLQESLMEYAGNDFANTFFEKYIYNSEIPNYKGLFQSVGLNLIQNKTDVFFGAAVKPSKKGLLVSETPKEESPAYVAGLDSGDEILSFDGTPIMDAETWKTYLKGKKVGEKASIKYLRNGKEKTTELIFKANPIYTISIDKNAAKKAIKARENWLKEK